MLIQAKSWSPAGQARLRADGGPYNAALRSGRTGPDRSPRELRMRTAVATALGVIVAVLGLAAQVRTGTLTIYYIDTEGGQSTLFVGPTGESLLVDTGNGGERDLSRIVDTLRTAGVSRIDHMWTT